jgi:conjugative relaxase-like TrwC/TraI family protein
VLSIGKLAAGQASYYLDQARGRVDVVDSIGDGLEEYYLGGSEARGEWIGTAACELGLEGAVEGEALRRVLAGLDPRDGLRLRSSSSPTRVAGFDLTFSAPKSVSVLFGVGNAEMRGRVRAAHDVATREAVAYLERSAAAVRRGHGGVVVEEASGLVAAAFRHRTSRLGDPQLHTHVLVANLGRGVDGRWSALDGRRLYARAKTASFVYQAVLRDELTRSIGVEWSPVRKGIAEVVGVRRPVLAAFSRRSADIKAALEERGTSGARAAEAAALATRRAKDRTTSADDLTREWRTRALAVGLGERELALIVGREQSAAPTRQEWETVFEALARFDGLTRRSPTFARDDVIQAVCERLPAGAAVEAMAIEAAADRFLASEHAVALLPGSDERNTGAVFRRRDGHVMPVDRQQLRYTTPAQLAMERRLVEQVLDSRGRGAGVADRRDVTRATAARPTLTDEQRAVVGALCREGDGIAVLSGKAGTGKTFTLGAAREAWQAAGYPVLGVATARRAAAELQEGAGIQSTSTFALLADLRARGAALPRRCVLVVDEAGMVATRDIAQLVDAVLAVDGKLVLVGDHRQLPEIQAGGTFRALVQRGLALELRENVRQEHAWERDALDQLRDGEPGVALAEYGRRGRLIVEVARATTLDRLVADWSAAAGDAVMIVRRRVDVAELNARARALLQAARMLGTEVDTPAGAFAIGDHVVVKRNDRRLGVNNGERGRVVAIESKRGALVVQSRGRRLELDRRFLAETTAGGDPPLTHGYAVTGHVAQGLTVDHALVLADEGIDREWAYVALSRGRQSNRMYLSGAPEDARADYAPIAQPPTDPVDRLARQLSSSSAQILAIDSGRTSGEASGQTTPQPRRLGWLPGRRQRLGDASPRETDASRERFELEHGARPFATEEDFLERVDRLHAEQAERSNERALRRARGMGREL